MKTVSHLEEFGAISIFTESCKTSIKSNNLVFKTIRLGRAANLMRVLFFYFAEGNVR